MRRHQKRNCRLCALPRRTRPESFPAGRDFSGLGPAERRRERLPNGKSRHGLVPARRRPPGSCRCRLTPRSPGACRTRRLSTATRWGGRARRTKATRLPRAGQSENAVPPAVAKGRLAPFGGLGSPERVCDRRSARRKLARVMEGRIVRAYFWAMLRLVHAWRDQPWKRLTRTSRRKMDTCCAVPDAWRLAHPGNATARRRLAGAVEAFFAKAG